MSPAKFIAIAFMAIVIVVVSVAVRTLASLTPPTPSSSSSSSSCSFKLNGLKSCSFNWNEHERWNEIQGISNICVRECVCVRAKWQMCPFKLKYEIMSAPRQWRWQWGEVCVRARANMPKWTTANQTQSNEQHWTLPQYHISYSVSCNFIILLIK